MAMVGVDSGSLYDGVTDILDRIYAVRTTATQTYLSKLVQTRAPPRAQHASDAPTFVVPRIHTELARRAFSVAAPSTWNSLPAKI